MPNHVENDLRIHGNLEDIKTFFEEVKGKEAIDANKIVPYPKAFAKQDELAEKARAANDWSVKDGFNSGGYDWCCENWGTKWGTYDCGEITWFKKSATISFLTAWSPPFPLIVAMSKKYPHLTFTLRYYEGGMAFKGVFKVKDGEVLKDLESAYHGSRGG